MLGQNAAPQDPLIADVLSLLEPGTGSSGRAAFHADTLSPAGQRRWPLARFDKVFGEIASLSNGFDFVAVDRRGTTWWLTLRARRQQVQRTLRVRIDREDPKRLFDISSFPDPTPYSVPLPQGPIAPADLPKLVAQRIGFAAMRDEFSGACRIVSPTGKVVYEAAVGMVSLSPSVPNTPDTRFHLGSADKSFTALLVARLVAEGRLTFETSLAEVLPNYPNVDFARACTIRHLLSHSAGLGTLFDRRGYNGTKAYSRMSDPFPAFAAEQPAFPPGTASAYSNEGFVVLGAVVEQVTGESWYDLLNRHIYRPAGMASSGHFLAQDLPERVATGYRYREDDHLGLDPRQPNADFLGYRGNSCGGGYSTVANMTAYLTALRAGRILPRAIVDQLVTQQKPGLREYGLGFQVKPLAPGRTLIGHGGGGPHSGIDGMNGIVWETGWAFSLLGNYDAPFAGTIAEDLATLCARVA
ncbi:MAG: hypothetical protein BVN32_13855 [Proteobacteria bacterium ST_bin14]|nr:MAG: hypothetical protein BVN32_13855 [Proteobacteria bacterium ST_bin14]